MTTAEWITVACFLVGGVLVGLILSRIINSILGKPSRPKPLQDAARPLATLGFWGGVIGGLIGALGIMQPEALADIPKNAVAYLPRVLTAAVIIIGANVLVAFLMAALGPALSRASASVQRQVAMTVKALVVGLAALLAVAQLGIDTTVINLAVAAIFFGAAASFTLLVGLGGREVASEVAATRATKRLVAEGDELTIGSVSGTVVAIHPTAVELKTSADETVLMPSSHIVAETITITRVSPKS